MSALAVVVGVIVNRAGEILLAKRAAHQHQGGLWEFPGGKLEVGEAPLAGLWRELQEELGIAVVRAEPLLQIHHQYPDKSVLLDVYRVSEFDGVPQGREGQPLLWVPLAELDRYPLPAANRPILDALKLPQQLCISGEAASPELWIKRLANSLQADTWILARPYNHAQLAWPWAQLIRDALALSRAHNSRLLLHSQILLAIAPEFNRLDADDKLDLLHTFCQGVHLTSAAAAEGLLHIPDGFMQGMACHNEEALAQAAALHCHYALLSPVLPTQTHPDSAALGWSEFARLCRAAKLPVFALGGVDARHRALAQQLGAQGVAGIRGFWREPS